MIRRKCSQVTVSLAEKGERRNPALQAAGKRHRGFSAPAIESGSNDVTNVINLFADDKGKRSVDAVQHQRQTIQRFLEQLDNAQKFSWAWPSVMTPGFRS